MIEITGEGKSALATPDAKSRKKKEEKKRSGSQVLVTTEQEIPGIYCTRIGCTDTGI